LREEQEFHGQTPLHDSPRHAPQSQNAPRAHDSNHSRHPNLRPATLQQSTTSSPLPSTTSTKITDISTIASPLLAAPVSTLISSSVNDVSTAATVPLSVATLSPSATPTTEGLNDTDDELECDEGGNVGNGVLKSYFLEKSKNANQAELCCRVANEFIEAERLDFDALVDVMTIWSKVCMGSTRKLERLILGRNKFKHHFTHMLSILYFAHEVDHITLMCGERAGARKKKGAAFTIVAKALGIPRKTVAAEYRKSMNLFQVIEQEGPGTLVQIGMDTASM
jgi:hypothetical protein